jgi:hypothetical protein
MRPNARRFWGAEISGRRVSGNGRTVERQVVRSRKEAERFQKFNVSVKGCHFFANAKTLVGSVLPALAARRDLTLRPLLE